MKYCMIGASSQRYQTLNKTVTGIKLENQDIIKNRSQVEPITND